MNILVAYDGSSFSDKALDKSVEMARKMGGTVTLVSVAPDPCLPAGELSDLECHNVVQAVSREAESFVNRAAERAEAVGGVEVRTMVVSGNPADEIMEAAKKLSADLIVLGSRGRHGLTQLFLGSVSGRVADHAACDVMIVK